MHKSTDEVWDPLRLAILVLSTLFCEHKSAGEIWDQYRLAVLVLKSPCCLMKPRDEAWDQETHVIVGAKHAVLSTQIHRWDLGPIETSNFGAKHAVLHALNHRWGLGPIETCNSGIMALLCKHKSKEEVWNQSRLVIHSFPCTKPQKRAGTHTGLLFRGKAPCFVCTNPQMRSGKHTEL